MFKPNEIEAMPVVLEGYFKELENRIVEDIVRRIKINSEITSTADLQMQRLSEMGASKKAVRDYIQQALQLSEQGIDDLYNGAIRKGYNSDRDLYTVTGRDFIPYAENQQLQQLVEAVKKQTNSDIKNITQSMGFAVRQPDGKLTFQPIADYYQKTLDKAVLDITSGSFDYNTVLKRTVQEMTDSGLRWIDYASGHHNRVPVAVRRAVMTGVNQVTAKIAEQNMELLQTEYVEVSWHRGARPSHQVWQGKIYHWKEKALSRRTATTPTKQNYQPIPIIDITEPSTEKYYKPVLLSDYPEVSERKRKQLILHKALNTSNNIYISEKIKLKPKRQHEIDQIVSQAIAMVNTENMCNLPKIYLVSSVEMNADAIASYNPYKNIMYIDIEANPDNPAIKKFFSRFVYPEKYISTFIHEFLHWKDAEQYREKYGDILTKESYIEFDNYILKKSKKKLDELNKKGYNIKDISGYASDSYNEGKFDETYTEYRTKMILERSM